MAYVIKESDYDFKDIVEGNLRSMITKQVANTHNKQFGEITDRVYKDNYNNYALLDK